MAPPPLVIGSRRLARRLLRVRALHTAPLRVASGDAHASRSSVAAHLDAWAQHVAQSRASAAAARAFLGVADDMDPASLSLKRRHEVVASGDFVKKVGAIAQWCFQAHGAATAQGNGAHVREIEAVLADLMPWGNMAKGDVWQHFYIRRFFLSGAPLDTFVACYGVHCRALEAKNERFLPLPASLLMRELCWRGRFDEALDAYAQLPLKDSERRSFTATLFEYEQYATLREVYALQDAMDEADDRESPLLDPVFILHALKDLGLRDELVERFESLPHEDQSRAEIQKLLADA